jgi:hypothetical protein
MAKKLDKEKLKKVEDLFDKVFSDPNIVSGIHNYCDRWCERCTHTSQCAIYRMESEMELDTKEMDLHNQKFWDHLSTMFQLASKMLEEMLEEKGIDPTDLPKVESKLNIKENPAVKISHDYTMSVSDWLKHNSDAFSGNHELFTSNSGENISIINDAFEVVQYYFILVSSKTYRTFLPREHDDEQHDALGSAKITLIIIERTSAAWVKLMEAFPRYEDDILGFLKKLAQVKRLILEQFPKAMDFIRPGFDE